MESVVSAGAPKGSRVLGAYFIARAVSIPLVTCALPYWYTLKMISGRLLDFALASVPALAGEPLA